MRQEKMSELDVKHFERACRDLIPQFLDTIMVWGAGNASVAKMFMYRGLRVDVVDGNIWDSRIGKGNKFLMGYSVGVLEYMPEKKVLRSLRVIHDHTEDVAWFAIRITERPAQWWAAMFAGVFPRFKFEVDDGVIYVISYCKGTGK